MLNVVPEEHFKALRAYEHLVRRVLQILELMFLSRIHWKTSFPIYNFLPLIIYEALDKHNRENVPAWGKIIVFAAKAGF